MVKHIYIDIDDPQYNFLLKLKGNKDWKTFFLELASQINPEGEIIADLLQVKQKALYYIQNKEKLSKLNECLDQAVKIIEDKQEKVEAKAN